MSTHNNPLGPRDSPLLCYVTDRHSLRITNPANALPALIQKIEEVAAAGIDWVQIREKDLPAREFASLTRQALSIAAKYSVNRPSPIRVLVNDRLDVAIAERADGVHLGEPSLPVAEVRTLIKSGVLKQIVGESFLIGASCHSIEAAQSAEQKGADYIFFGPIFATPSKQSFGPPQGLERLTQICRSVKIPVLAIGGITPNNVKSCIDSGAAGIAAIRLFYETPDAALTLGRLHQLPMDSPPQ